MAVRARLQNKMSEQTSNAPHKVEAKVFQGPTVQRTTLGDLGNSSLARHRGNKTHDVLKKSLSSQPSQPLPGMTTTSVASHTNTHSSRGLARVPSLPLKRFSIHRKSHKENADPTHHCRKERKDDRQEEEDKENEEEEGEEAMEVEQLTVAFSTQCLDVEDIDIHDVNNPQLVSEYVCDIYDYLRTLEDKTPVKQHFMLGQAISPRMRSILIDWLVQVHSRFTLLQETLYLTVGIIDRYLQKERNIGRNTLQLVGVGALFVACKFEEMYCVDVGDLSMITDKAYTVKQILDMEIKILKTLEYNVSFPLPLHFLRRDSKAGGVDSKQHTLAKYLMELCLPEYSMSHYKASMLAAAALCLTLRILNGGEWNRKLVFHSKYTEDQLMPLMCKMAALLVKSPHSKQQTVRQKYDSHKFLKISTIPELKSKIVTKLAEKSAQYT